MASDFADAKGGEVEARHIGRGAVIRIEFGVVGAAACPPQVGHAVAVLVEARLEFERGLELRIAGSEPVGVAAPQRILVALQHEMAGLFGPMGAGPDAVAGAPALEMVPADVVKDGAGAVERPIEIAAIAVPMHGKAAVIALGANLVGGEEIELGAIEAGKASATAAFPTDRWSMVPKQPFMSVGASLTA